jgi:hypothetical protein
VTNYKYIFVLDNTFQQHFLNPDIETSAPINFYTGMKFKLQLNSSWRNIQEVTVAKMGILQISQFSITQDIHVTANNFNSPNKES